MRARWTIDDLQAGRPRDWRLDARDGDRLRAGLASRLGTRATAPVRAAALTAGPAVLD